MVLTDEQVEKYADVLLWGLDTARKTRFKKGDIVLLQYDAAAVKLAEALFARLMEMRVNPVQRVI
jgi:aminopeptidase